MICKFLMNCKGPSILFLWMTLQKSFKFPGVDSDSFLQQGVRYRFSKQFAKEAFSFELTTDLFWFENRYFKKEEEWPKRKLKKITLLSKQILDRTHRTTSLSFIARPFWYFLQRLKLVMIKVITSKCLIKVWVYYSLTTRSGKTFFQIYFPKLRNVRIWRRIQ